MNKQEILDALVLHLQQLYNSTKKAAQEAKEAATSEESKPENKYDTRAVEASYMAGAQAKRANTLLHSINLIKEIDLSRVPVVKAIVDGDKKKTFIILHHAGGEKVTVHKHEVTVITPDSPIGKLILGKKAGDSFEFSTGAASHEYEIVEVL